MHGKTIGELKIGECASLKKTITENDVYMFAEITGDTNPAHVNEKVASQGIFKTRVAHGMLSASLISAVLGTKLPGPGAIYLGQDIQFLAPVFIGDTVCANVEVIEINNAKNICVLKTVCTNQLGKVVVNGKATILCKRMDHN